MTTEENCVKAIIQGSLAAAAYLVQQAIGNGFRPGPCAGNAAIRGFAFQLLLA